MRIQIQDVSLNHLQNALGDHGFGLVNSMDPYQNIPNHIAIWTGPLGGFEVGRIVKDIGSFPSYTMMIDTDRVRDGRIEKVITDLMKK